MTGSDDPRTSVSAFDAVDATGDAGAFIACLELQERTPDIIAWRAYGYDLLELERCRLVVDVGCGLGTAVGEMADRVDRRGRVSGFDVSEAMIAEARRRLGDRQNADVRVADALDLPVEAGAADVYRAERLFQHLPDQQAALAEARRVLRAGGRILLADAEPDSIAIDGTDRALTRAVLKSYPDSIKDGWCGRRLPGLLKDAGFVDVRVDVRMLATTDFATFGFYVDMYAALATEAGVPADDVVRWVDDQRARGETDRWFAAIPMYTATGRLP